MIPPVFGRMWRGLRASATRPLFLSQVCTSASGAIAMIMAAVMMDVDEFTLFTLISLVAVTLVGLVRSFLFQPALIEMRRDKNAFTPFRYAIVGAALAAVILTASALIFGGSGWVGLVALFVGGIFPILQDWLRFRAMALDRRWDVLLADGIRLALVLASPVLLAIVPEALAYQAYLGLSLALPVLVVRLRLPRLRSFTPLKSYLRPATLQLTDFIVGQFTSTIPLLVLGGLGASTLIAGVRFAQTLLGPLNLVFAASTTHLIADGATRGTHANTGQLIRSGKRLGRMLGAIASLCVLAAVAVVWLTGVELSGIRNEPLLIGLMLVGAATLSSGWAGIHAIVLRLTGHHAAVTVGRTVLVTVTLSSFAGGYAVGSVDASLAAGFLAAAVTSPLVFVIPASIVYRRYFRGNASADDR